MDIKEILLKLVAKQNGISEDAAAELLYQKSEDDDTVMVLKKDALKTLLEKDKDRVAKLKTTEVDKTKIYDEAYADAKKEILPKAEAKLAKKYGIEGDSFKLDKLVADIVSKETEGLQGDKLDENAVKKHPLYLTLERESKEAIESLTATHEEALNKVKSDYTRTETVTDVKGKVLSFFDKLNPVLSSDAKKAVNQREDFATSFSNKYNYEKQEDGSYLVLEGDKRVEDEHGTVLTLDKLVERDASRTFDFAVQNPKGGAGNEDGSGKGGKIDIPESEDAYNDAILEANTPEERAEITAAYEAANAT